MTLIRFYCGTNLSLFCFFVSLLFFCSCSGDRQEKEKNKEWNPIFVKEEELQRNPLSLSSIMDDYHYVPLETNDNSVITSIRELIYSDSIFFLQQITRLPALTFDAEGRFIASMGRVGRGPGEYLSYSAIDHRPDSEAFYILDAEQRKIIGYDRKGNLLSEIKLPTEPGANLKSFRSIDDEKFLVEVIPYLSSSVKPYVSLVGKDGQEIDRFEFESAVFTNGSLKSGLVRYGQSIYFMPEYSNVIYRYSEQRMIPYFEIDPKAGQDLRLLEQAHVQMQKSINTPKYKEAHHLYRGMWGISAFIETERFINFSYYYDATRVKSVHYDKTTRELSHCPLMDDIAEGIYQTHYTGSSANILFKALYPSRYANLDSLKDRIRTKNANIMDVSMRNTIDSLTINSNPVLICYRLK